MGKRIWLLFVIIVLTLSTGCDFNFTGMTQASPEGPSLDEISTLSAISTQAHTTPSLEIPNLSTFTSTPTLEITEEGGEQPTATETPDPGTIVISSITQRSPGVAQVSWDTKGDFPSGFKVVFTDQQSQPTYPENNNVSVFSSTARSAVFNVTYDRIYYVRVCRFLNDTCDIYSDLGIFVFSPPTQTPKPTRTPGTGTTNGTAIPYDSTLVIKLIKSSSAGKAYFVWDDKSKNSMGYKIVYSSSSQVPTYGVDSYFNIADSKARSAYIDGGSGVKYYYRICRFDGKVCKSYSSAYTFTFPTYTSPTSTSTAISSTMAITMITSTGTGIAQVNWSTTGTVTNGYKILYSKTTALPTLSDSVTVVSDSSARWGSISGDPSTLYHVRVCIFSGTDCIVYSPVVDFSFVADSAAINITGLADNASTVGSIDLDWTASGTFANGFKLLCSSNATPDLTNSIIATAASGALSGTIPCAVGTNYYVRICKFLGSTLGNCSSTLEFTTASSGIKLSANSTPGVFDWVLDPDNSNPYGYNLFWTTGTITPVWSSGLDHGTAASGERTISAALGSGHYIVRLCYLDTDATTCTSTYSNTVEVDIP